MTRTVQIWLLLGLQIAAQAQTAILCTNPQAEQVMLGNYDPALYIPSSPTTFDPTVLAAEIQSAISPDSLKRYIIQLSTFHTRNSGSDTLSATVGIGAARRWVLAKLGEFSTQNNNRLLPAYLQFDLSICGVNQHKNVMAVLPGYNPSGGVVLVEGHLDSRCSDVCDVSCLAEGVEDNATGTALVLELARVMSKYQFNSTVVFLLTTAEEQGLLGAEAFVDYAQSKSIPIRAVLNNDVIGGVICGQTSSPPSCPGLNNVDSTSVRLFSAGAFNSKHKQLARFIKLEYRENLLPIAQVPMNVRIMSPEDRSGRGGDHIPFRQKGFTAMRFTAANEHGDASNTVGYTDRQHTSDDVLGVDTDVNGAVDSFFVDFNYLARNAQINGNALAIAARNVGLPPNFTATRSGNKLIINFDTPVDTQTIRVALRSTTNDWDTVYTIGPAFSDEMICNPTGTLYASVAGVDAWGAESLFSGEKIVGIMSGVADEPLAAEPAIQLLQNRPNPFDEATWISFMVNELPAQYQKAWIQIADVQGKVLETLPVNLQQGMNEVLYTHGYGVYGVFSYALIIDGKTVDVRQMVFAN